MRKQYHLTIMDVGEHMPGTAISRLKRLLKVLLRGYGYRVTHIAEVADKGHNTPSPEIQGQAKKG